LTSGAGVAAWSDANPAAVAQLLADRAQVAIEFRLRSMMDEIEARPADRLQFAVELLRWRVSEPPVAARFLECVQVFELGLGCAKAKSEGEVLEAYAEGDKRYYRPLMARHPHLLENYLKTMSSRTAIRLGGSHGTPFQTRQRVQMRKASISCFVLTRHWRRRC
jgi:hypothetical protein